MEKGIGLVELIKTQLEIKDIDIRNLSPVVLAYIGDSIYDLVIKTTIVEQGNKSASQLHKIVTKYVKAECQAMIIEAIEENLSEEELGVYKRGRNAKVNTSAKNASIQEYRKATGFEALVGYLYLNEEYTRVIEIVKEGLEKIDVEIVRN